jgi:hypothetical protein
MATQIGDIKIRGTIAGITFYKMQGGYYARRQSSLTGARVKRDPRFRRTMASAHRLALGSRLASSVYRSLPRAEQVYALFCRLKRAAIAALKQGMEAEVVKCLLQSMTGTNNPVHRWEKKEKRNNQEKETMHRKGQMQVRHCMEALLLVDADGRLKKKGLNPSGIQPMANAP